MNIIRKKDPVSKNKPTSQAPVTHPYNPSYLGGRDLEDCSSRPAKAKS
jgi:hypothetical protein